MSYLPSLSIVIPCHNEEDVLEISYLEIKALIDSWNNQFISRYQIVMVNNGSTDSTLEKMLALKKIDNNIKIVSKIKEKAKPLDKLECARFCKALNIPKITIRDYQFNAFYHAIQEDRCLLLSPTASGKSLIAYLILRFQLLRIKEKKAK